MCPPAATSPSPSCCKPDIGSTGGLTKSGPGALTLTAANTYAGATTVNGGTLVANTAAKLGNSHLTVNTAATCDLRNPAGAIADAASVFLNGTGKLIIASGVAETVTRLYVNNALQAAGTYTAVSHPALISGSGSLVVTTATPVAPTTLVATAASQTTINLSWSDNDIAETGYLVERSATAGSGFTQIASLPANTTAYADASRSADSTWFYRVRASGTLGNSAYSNEASATTLPNPPDAPTGPVATAGGFAVRLEWTASPSATGYRIKRSNTSGSGFTEIGTATATSFIDTGLAAGVPVFYRIAAENTGGIGSDSAETSATPLAILQWDGADTVTAGAQGGNGAWNSTALWWNAFSNASWPATGLTNEAVFGGSAGNVSLDPAGVAANKLTFNTTGYLLQTGPLTLNGTNPAIFTASAVTASISSPIHGTAGLAKSGPGTLILSGANPLTGNLATNAGTLQFNTGLSLAPSAILQLGDVSGTEAATISWNNNSLTTANPLIVRSGSIGTKSLSANTSVTSSIASLELNDNLTKTGSGTLTVTGGTTLKGGNRILTADAGTLTLGGTLSSVGGTYGLTKSGAGILRLNGDNSGYAGTVTFAQASLHVGHANALGTGAFINSTNTNTLTNVSGAAITLSNSSYSISSSLIIGGSTSAADILTGPGTFSLIRRRAHPQRQRRRQPHHRRRLLRQPPQGWQRHHGPRLHRHRRGQPPRDHRQPAIDRLAGRHRQPHPRPQHHRHLPRKIHPRRQRRRGQPNHRQPANHRWRPSQPVHRRRPQHGLHPHRQPIHQHHLRRHPRRCRGKRKPPRPNKTRSRHAHPHRQRPHPHRPHHHQRRQTHPPRLARRQPDNHRRNLRPASHPVHRRESRNLLRRQTRSRSRCHPRGRWKRHPRRKPRPHRPDRFVSRRKFHPRQQNQPRSHHRHLRRKTRRRTFTASGQNWQISYLGGDGNDVVVTIVPTSAIETWRQLHFGTPRKHRQRRRQRRS